MAKRKTQKDVIKRLTETGEEALQRIVELPGGPKVVEAANAVRDRVDDLTKKVRRLDPLERRVTELERRLDALSKPKPARKSGSASASAKGRASSSARAKKPGSSS